MKNISKKSWISSIVFSVLFATCCLFLMKIYEASTAKDVLLCLCNSFFIVGLGIIGVGLLMWCSNQGAFTGLTYSFREIFIRRRSEKSFSEREKYSEYKERRLEKKASFVHLLIIGSFYLVLSIIFYCILEGIQ